MPVLEHLPEIVVGVADLIVGDYSALFDGNDFRIDEAAVRLEIQGSITLADLLVKIRVNLDAAISAIWPTGTSLNGSLKNFIA